MNIRNQEDELFKSWKKEYPDQMFVIDGAPCPEVYKKSSEKCLIILKDVNIDPKDVIKPEFDLRGQLENEPHPWWRTIANWCTAISNVHAGVSNKWSNLEKSDIRESLKPFAIMQLKKTTGGGSVSAEKINEHEKRDAEFIRKQIDIYEPKVIICCGVGENIANILGNGEWSESSRGVRYMKLSMDDGYETKIIDYMHPSARAAKNIVCFGLLDVYVEIVLGV